MTGKTLQVIALFWTLLRQGPRGREALKRVLVVTPSSLMQNWAAEIRKWLGNERISTLVLLPGADAVQEVLFGRGALDLDVSSHAYYMNKKYTMCSCTQPSCMVGVSASQMS